MVLLHGIYSQHCVHTVNINKLANQKRFLKMNCLYHQRPSCQELSLVTLCTVLLQIFLSNYHIFQLRKGVLLVASGMRRMCAVFPYFSLLCPWLLHIGGSPLKAILQSLRSRMLMSFSPFFFISLLMPSSWCPYIFILVFLWVAHLPPCPALFWSYGYHLYVRHVHTSIVFPYYVYVFS